MPVEVKPLFRPDILRPRIKSFELPPRVTENFELLRKWSDLLTSPKAASLKEQELLRDFLTDVFVTVLGYERPADNPDRYTFSPEKHVQVDGKFADAVLGEFGDGPPRFVIALEGKGPTDPLDRPFKSRKMSAVDQGYRYAINLQCDWIIVTSMRETRLYYKGTDQLTYERFRIEDLVKNEWTLKRFVFLLAAERVVPMHRPCHLFALRDASNKADKELTKDFYLRYAEIREDVFEQLCTHNDEQPRHALLSATQKLLDRVLFCAFCEDRGLLPENSLEQAFEHRDPYNPRPIWANFRGLFHSIDRGNKTLDIPAYNGGLFAVDSVLDELDVPDSVCQHFRNIGAYDYRPVAAAVDEELESSHGTLIDVDILGHIFEQSITDLEQIRNELDGLVPPQGKEKHKTRRKKEGAFYTPAFITRYIVEQTLGRVLEDRFEELRIRHEAAAKATARKVLSDPKVYNVDTLNNPQRDALVTFWEAWQDELARIRVLDPACGSGAFLIEAFDQLHTAYVVSNDRLEEIRGHRTLFDLDRRILQNNLYGVDLNEEAIQICRLSLWIKTAQRGKELTSLDHTIRVGNSVVTDPEVHPLAFDWETAFPVVMEAGGFDVVVGNPPYIRQEWLKPYKKHWEERFQSHSSSADIFVYFYELGLNLLKTDGRLGFITSGSWVRGNFGAPLRGFLAEQGRIESMIDFGEFQPFEGAEMIRPTIAVIRKRCERGPMRLFKWLTKGHPPENLSDVIRQAPVASTTHLGRTTWDLESNAVISLRNKLRNSGTPLGAIVNSQLFRGVTTGLNDAFVIDGSVRTRLISDDPSSDHLIKPFVQGTNLRPWYIEPTETFLIFTRRGIDIDRYPAIREYLSEFRERLEPKPNNWTPTSNMPKWPGRKPGTYQWYEIQDTVDYWKAFEQPKIVWPDIAKLPRFTIDNENWYLGNTGYVIPHADYYLLGVLASWVSWFFISKTAQPLRLRGDRWQYRLIAQFMKHLPIPDAATNDKDFIGSLARTCTDVAKQKVEIVNNVRRRLLSSFGEDSDCHSRSSLNQKAAAWWTLNFHQLGAALKTSFKLKGNPFKNPRTADEWEPYFNEKRAEVNQLSRQIADAEAELNDRVYRLFKLTKDEIALLQREVEH